MRGKKAANPICKVDGCDKRTRSLEMCAMHYARLQRRGDVGGPKPEHAASWAGIGCKVDGCNTQVNSLGYCTAHLKRFKRWGDPNIKRPTTPADERFWSRVDKGGDCWQWKAGKGSHGYGTFHPTKTTNVLAHRYAYESAYGPIPDGLVIDHLCRNRLCVNPMHLEAVTNEENLARGLGYALRNGMRTACVHGHAYTPENTYISPSGDFRCRQCSRERDRQPHRNAALRRANRKAA